MAVKRAEKELSAYRELKRILVNSFLVEKNKNDIKRGEKILIIKRGLDDWEEIFTLATVKKVTEEKIELKDVAMFDPNDFLRTYTYESEMIYNNYSFYKIRNPESIFISKDYSTDFPEIFETLKKEITRTLEYRFVGMDQELPVEMVQMLPEKRLGVNKKFEEMLERKTERIEYDDYKRMSELKQLFGYAARCGVESARAKGLYKQKWSRLKKEQKRVLKELKMDD